MWSLVFSASQRWPREHAAVVSCAAKKAGTLTSRWTLVEEMQRQAPCSCPDVDPPGAGDNEGDAQVVARVHHRLPCGGCAFAGPICTRPLRCISDPGGAAVLMEREMCLKVHPPGLRSLQMSQS